MINRRISHTDIPQVCASFLYTSGECLFTLTNPNTRIVVLQWVSASDYPFGVAETYLLVWLILALRVTHLCHEVLFLLQDEVLHRRPRHNQFVVTDRELLTYPDAKEICPLGVCGPGKGRGQRMGKERTSVHIHLDDAIANGGLDLFLG